LSANAPNAAPDEPRPARGFSFPGAAMKSLKATRADAAILGVVLGALFVAGLLAMRHRGVYTDELNHYSQIELFLRGEFRVFTRYLTTIPGYHAIVAAILKMTGGESLDAARLVNAAFALIAVAGFHALRKRLWPGTETLATAQLLALPILVPLFFLVYTDVLAIALLRTKSSGPDCSARSRRGRSCAREACAPRAKPFRSCCRIACPSPRSSHSGPGTDRSRSRTNRPRCIPMSACTPAISSSRSSSPACCCRST